VLSAEGARWVAGRSRGGGKRSAPRLEPMAARDRGGRPGNEGHQDLVMHLAIDWLIATDKKPRPSRTDSNGFGDLVHCVFQWLNMPDGSATYALRQYWAATKKEAQVGEP